MAGMHARKDARDARGACVTGRHADSVRIRNAVYLITSRSVRLVCLDENDSTLSLCWVTYKEC
eukprot:6184574-Pleurochrysis_carterae.AAC.3